MRKIFLSGALLASSLFWCGCASSYKAINPEILSFTKDNSSSKDVTLEYHHNVLAERRNRKYVKKESKWHLQVVAVKITNNSDVDLEYGKNFQLYSGESVLPVLQPQAVYSQLKQQVPTYLLYLLLSPLKLYVNTNTSSSAINSNTETYPIGLFIGPAITIGNMLVASSANAKFQKELNDHSLFNKTIKKGETFYTLIGINETTFKPISLRLMNTQNSVQN